LTTDIHFQCHISYEIKYHGLTAQLRDQLDNQSDLCNTLKNAMHKNEDAWPSNNIYIQ